MKLTRSVLNRFESWLLSGLSEELRSRWTDGKSSVRRRILSGLAVLVLCVSLLGCATITTTAPDGTITVTRQVDSVAVAQAVLLAQQVMPGVATQLTELWAAQQAAEVAHRRAESEDLQAKIQALIDVVNAVRDSGLTSAIAPKELR